MSTITLRSSLPANGPGLTTAQIDANFTNLNGDKMEKASNLSDLTDKAAARDNLQVDAAGTARKLAIALG